MKTETEIALEKTHQALNDVLSLFVSRNGTDYNAVEKAWEAMAFNLRLPNAFNMYLPVTAAYAAEVQLLMKETK